MTGEVPGTAHCVIRDGELVEVQYEGTRCHLGAEINGDTIWEVASLTKPVLSRHVVQLAQAGEVDLAEPADLDLAAINAVPDKRWENVTVRQLLTHTSGLPNWRGPLTALLAAGYEVDASSEKLVFGHEPGTFSYSGEGFEALLSILCKFGGCTAFEVLEPLLAPLGMVASSFIWHDRFAENVAVPHQEDGEALPKMHPRVARAAGSLHATMDDYSAFAAAVLEEGMDDVFEPCVHLDEVNGRSLGWGTVKTANGVVAWQHGDNLGFKHLVALRRDQGDGVVILTNGDRGHDIWRELARQVLGVPW